MNDEPPSTDDVLPPAKPGWEPLPHKRLPRPTYFPAGLAMGTTFIFWGFITSWVISVVGVGLFTASLVGWIREILLERHE